MENKKKLDIAILMVNGESGYRDKLWVEISVANIVKYISGEYTYKIFLWNHNVRNTKVHDYLASFGDIVEVLDEGNYDMSQYDPGKKYCTPGRWETFAGGYHVHRTPLQILYDYAVSNYSVDIVFTFDNDSCPIRANWDIPMVYALNHGKKLVGIWRSEMNQVIEPYIHPSFLGLKVETVRDCGLRFDNIPVFPKQDSLSHITAAIRERYGAETIYPLLRNNKKQYHTVFNGVYGSLMYHHHFGTRNGMVPLKSFGWQERKEKMIVNRVVMDGTTEMLFSDDQDYFNLLAFGINYTAYKLYWAYLKADYSRFRAMKLLHYATEEREKDIDLCFFLLTLVQKELGKEKKFLTLFIATCTKLGFEMEAKAYQALLEKI